MMIILDFDYVVNEEIIIMFVCYIEGILILVIIWIKVDGKICYVFYVFD